MVFFVCKSETVEFKAIPNPSDTPFPANSPTWSGDNVPNTGNIGETISITYPTSSAVVDDKTITAKCCPDCDGVTENLTVVAYDIKTKRAGTDGWDSGTTSIAVGNENSNIHQADVEITTEPVLADVVIPVNLSAGKYTAGKDAVLTLNGVQITATLDGTTTDVTTDTEGKLIGTLLSSDVLTSAEPCTIKADCETKDVQFVWDNYTGDDFWTTEPEFLLPDSEMTNRVIFRLDDIALDNHTIKFYIEEVTYVGLDDFEEHTETNPPGAPQDLSEFGEFLNQPVVTDANGIAEATLKIKDPEDKVVLEMILVAYDFSARIETNNAAAPVAARVILAQANGAGDVDRETSKNKNEDEQGPAFIIKSVEFKGNKFAAVTSDAGTVLGPPHWEDNSDPPNKNATDNDDKRFPVSYQSGSKPKVEVKFTVKNGDKIPSGTQVFVEGTGTEGFDFPSTAGTIAGGFLTATIESGQMFTNLKVDIFNGETGGDNPFKITWKITIDGKDYKDIGESDNTLYVTHKKPQGTTRHTVIHIGCLNADGQTVPATIVAKIYDEFTDLDVERVNIPGAMTFHKDGQSACFNTEDLLAIGDGACEAWSGFLDDCFELQGIKSGKVMSIRPKPLPKKTEQGLAIILALKAQGNQLPVNIFPSHSVVIYKQKIYDPSYGSNVFDTLIQWEDNALLFALYKNKKTGLPEDEKNTNAQECILTVPNAQ